MFNFSTPGPSPSFITKQQHQRKFINLNVNANIKQNDVFLRAYHLHTVQRLQVQAVEVWIIYPSRSFRPGNLPGRGRVG